MAVEAAVVAAAAVVADSGVAAAVSDEAAVADSGASARSGAEAMAMDTADGVVGAGYGVSCAYSADFERRRQPTAHIRRRALMAAASVPSSR